MQVVALSTPTRTGWSWRIVNAAGEVIEESRERFPSIAQAVATGRNRLSRLKLVDRSVPPRPYRAAAQLKTAPARRTS
jgi:hypothetical protein